MHFLLLVYSSPVPKARRGLPSPKDEGSLWLKLREDSYSLYTFKSWADSRFSTVAMSIAATVAYFALQEGATVLSAATLPAPPAPDGLMWATIVLALASFAVAALAQTTFPLWAGHPAAAGLRVHLMNGFYLNAVSDRLAGRWTSKTGAHQ